MMPIYPALSACIANELKELEHVVERCLNIWQQPQSSGDDRYIDGVALYLQSFYTGLGCLDSGCHTINRERKAAMKASESQVLEALRRLDPSRWNEVLDFISFLQQRTPARSTAASICTARDLLQSDVIGIWADRTDIGDSLTFARQLRQQESRSGGTADGA